MMSSLIIATVVGLVEAILFQHDNHLFSISARCMPESAAMSRFSTLDVGRLCNCPVLATHGPTDVYGSHVFGLHICLANKRVVQVLQHSVELLILRVPARN